jgi:hypothetical protein
MDIDKLKELNPAYDFYTIDDEVFRKYGRKLDYSSEKLRSYVYHKLPVLGAPLHYEPDYSQLHRFVFTTDIQNDIFAGQDIQFGIIAGYNESANEFQYHTSGECILAFTDCIFALGSTQLIQSGSVDINLVDCFLMKAGECVQLYDTTMNSFPIHADLNGFEVGVITVREEQMNQMYFVDTKQKDIRIRCINR